MMTYQKHYKLNLLSLINSKCIRLRLKADEVVAESEAERAETNFYMVSEVFRELFGFLMSLTNTEKKA